MPRLAPQQIFATLFASMVGGRSDAACGHSTVATCCYASMRWIKLLVGFGANQNMFFHFHFILLQQSANTGSSDSH